MRMFIAFFLKMICFITLYELILIDLKKMYHLFIQFSHVIMYHLVYT